MENDVKAVFPMAQKGEATEAVRFFAVMSPQEQRDAMMFMSGVRAAQGVQSTQNIRPTV